MPANESQGSLASPDGELVGDLYTETHPSAALPLDELVDREIEAAEQVGRGAEEASSGAPVPSDDPPSPGHGLVAANYSSSVGGMWPNAVPPSGADSADWNPRGTSGPSRRPFWLVLSGAGVTAMVAVVAAVAIAPLAADGAIGVESALDREFARAEARDPEPVVDETTAPDEQQFERIPTLPEGTAIPVIRENKERKRRIRRPVPPLPEMPSREAIIDVVKSGANALGPCLRTARKNGELPAGRHTLVLNWRVRPDGKVANARMTGPGPLLGSSLRACVPEKMSKWRFPRSQRGVPVKRFPFGPINVR